MEIEVKEEKKSYVLERLLWNIVWAILIFPFPRRMALKWEIPLLNLFGAKIHKTAHIYSSTKIWLPRNLQMDEYSILGDHVQVFNVDKVHLKAYACVSQFANIYPSSRDMNNDDTFVTSQPVVIGEKAWVASYSYLGMGSNIGREAVIGAGTVVRSAIPPYSMVIGNPAKVTGFRYTLDEIIEREKTVYKDEEQIPEDLLRKNYDKYFLNRLKEIKEFTKL